jgi:hypothetical protein
MLGQHRLDLAELNTKAPHLDLMVDAPQEFDPTIRQVADQVPCLVQSCTGLTAEWMGYESFGRERWSVQVTF